MYKLTDQMFIDLWGQELLDQCKEDSNRVAGNAFFDVILAAAIGRILENQKKLLKAQVNTTGL